MRNCCVCSSSNQNCTSCLCARNNVRCRGCKKGNNCRNPLGRDPSQDEEAEGAWIIPGNDNREEGRNQPVEPDEEVEAARMIPGNDNREERRNQPADAEPQRDVVPGRVEAENEGEGNLNLNWKGLRDREVKIWVEAAYSEVVRWSARNQFEPPKCEATTEMIKEMTSLVNNYNHNTPLAPDALTIVLIMPHLFLQRTHSKSKVRDNITAIRRRVEMWKKNDLNGMLNESRALQERLHKPGHKEESRDKARSFGDSMRQGNVASAIRSLTEESSGGVLPCTRQTIKELREKHPPASSRVGLRMEGEHVPPNPIIYERITGETIWKKALQTQGSAGPSGLDAKGWRVILSKTKFGAAASDLCNSIAALTRKLAATNCQHLEALTASRLIPLEKKDGGCRPIGIGEVLRRIIGKSIMEVVKDDVRTAAGNLQVCAGHQAGAEAAIHAIREIYKLEDCEAVLLVDASNAFNSINRKTTLHNIKINCPSLAKYVENTYRNPSNLYVMNNKRSREGEAIQSMEGTTQGDPVAMAMYALGLSALQKVISHEKTQVKQVAYADDLTGAGKVADIKQWWDLVKNYGPEIGYHPNASKSVLIVKPLDYDRAVQIFQGSGVIITSEGQRHLGAVIGTDEFKKEYVKKVVSEWVEEIKRLADIARTEPHAAYSSYTHGVKHRWNFVMRTIPNIEQLLLPLEKTIREKFIPAMAKGYNVNNEERALLALPPRLGGMGIINPSELATNEHQNSVKLTRSLVECIMSQDAGSEVDQAELHNIRMTITNDRQKKQKSDLEQLMQQLSPTQQKKVQIAQETGASNWLTTLPIRAKGFNLNKQEFNDSVALRYSWPIEGLPSQCVCGAVNDVNHVMVCKKGGFVCIRHDEVRDLTASMLKEVCHDVAEEPTLLPLHGEEMRHRTANTANEARVDVSARGFWTRGQRAFFDIRIFDPMAACHRELSLEAAHTRNEREKNRAYEERIREVDHGTFTPLVFTSSGGMGPRARCFYSRLAEIISEKKQQPRSHVVAWMRCRLSFSLLRSALLCLRGTRQSPPKPTNIEALDFEATVAESRINVRLS